MPAPEVFLSFVGARTERIHLGTAITNTTPPVNHPARIAERAAMLDQLSEGRFEFGTGRGSSSVEVFGFGIDSMDTTRDMFDEALPEIVKMMGPDEYGPYEDASVFIALSEPGGDVLGCARLIRPGPAGN